VACKKTTPASTPSVNQAMSATINGTVLTADSIFSVSSAGFFIIGKRKLDSTGIKLAIPSSSSSPGTYQVGTYVLPNGVVGGYSFIYGQNGNTGYGSTSGTIIITSNSNGIMAGTFEGSAKNIHNINNNNDVVTITNGSFTVKH